MNRDSVSGFNQAPPVETLPHLDELVHATSAMYDRIAKDGRPDLFPGFSVYLLEGHAIMRQDISPTRYVAVDIFKQGTTWYITQELQRPMLETEGFGGTVREAKTFPLDPFELTTSSRTTGHLNEHGILIGEEDVQFGEPISEGICVNLLNTLRAVDSLPPVDVNRAPKGRGWLRQLFSYNSR